MDIRLAEYLVVEGTDDDFKEISDQLHKLNIPPSNITHLTCRSGLEGRFTDNDSPNVIFFLHDSFNGVTLKELTQTPAASSQAVKFLLTRAELSELAAQALKNGIHDYLLKEDLQPHKLAKAIGLGLERMEMKRQLHQASERFEAVFNHSASAILLANDKGEYVDVNPAAAEMLGYSTEELKALKKDDVIHPEIADEIEVRWQHFLSRKTEDGVIALRKKDGSKLIASYKAVAGILPGLHLSILTDITEQSMTCQREKLQKEILRLISNNDDFQGNLTAILKSICAATGWSASELWWVDKSESNIFLDGSYHNELDSSFDDFRKTSRHMHLPLEELETVSALLTKNEVCLFDSIGAHPDFQRKNCIPKSKNYMVAAAPIRKANNGRGLLVLFKESHSLDDTDRRLLNILLDMAAELLGDEVEKLRMRSELDQVIMTSNDLIGILNFQRQFIKVNPAFEQTFGYNCKNRQKLFIEDIIPPESVDNVEKLIERARQGEAIQMEDVLTVTRTGEKKWIEISANLNAAAGTIYLIGRDVTSYKESQRNLLEANRKFQLATKTAQMGIWEVDLINSEVIIDKGIASIYGIDSHLNSISLEQWQGFLHPEDEAMALAEYSKTLIEQDTFNLQHRIIDGHGNEKHLRVTAEIVKNESEVVAVIGLSRDVSDYVNSENAKSRALADLGERIKEQTCLYNISKISLSGITVEELLKQAVQYIPTGWQHTEITVARIQFGDKTYSTPGFEETSWTLKTTNKGISEGELQLTVAYLKEMPELDEGPFMAEERQLIDVIGGHLATSIDQILSKQKLEEREVRFRNLIENNHDAIVIQDEDFVLKYASPSIERITGYSVEELVGSCSKKYVHPEDLSRISYKIEKILQGVEHTVEFKERIRRKDGNFLWINATVTDHRNLPGINGLVYNFKDIDTEERTRMALELNKERLKRALNIARMGYWRLNPETRESFWSKEAYQLFELDHNKDTLDYETFSKMVHPDDHHKFRIESEALKPGAKLEDIEYRVIKPNGETMWLRGHAHVTIEEDTGSIILEGAVQDITERKLTELKLEEREERFRLFLEHSPLLSWLKDEDGRLLAANPKFFQETGRTKADLNKDPELYYHHDSSLGTLENDRKVIRSGMAMKFIEQVPNRDGEWRTYESYKFPFKSDNRTILGNFALDITERKKHQEAIETQNKKLREIAWLQSHVVRAPLARLMGLIELFNQHTLNKQDQREVADQINKSAMELDQVINDMVSYSKEIDLNLKQGK